VPDAQSLSSGGGDAAGEPGGGHEVVFGHLDGTVQSPAQTLRTPLERALQGVGGGEQRKRLLEDGMRLCASESGAGQVAGARAGFAGISLEQLAGVFEASEPAAALAAGGSPAGRISPGPGPGGAEAAIGSVPGGAARGGSGD